MPIRSAPPSAGVRGVDVGRVIKDKTLHGSEGYRRRVRETMNGERVKATSAIPFLVSESAHVPL